MRTLCIILAMLLPAALASPAGARELAADQAKAPTKIVSDTMRYDQAAGTVVFEGKVHVERPDFQLWAGSITVHFAPQDQGRDTGAGRAGSPPAEAGRIEKITARGAVRIEREGKVGTCQTATYLVQEGLLSMEGDPVLLDGENRVEGRVVKLYFKDNRSEVLGGEGKRVEATFMTPRGLKP